jgi:PHD/YefM family antitoxin component YafN of YafNO toxin-antitoxin module
MSEAVWVAGGYLPVMGECSEELAERIAEGQPVVLTLAGRPAAVVVDVDTWAEIDQV